MKINIQTGDFIITEDPESPIILMVFNLFEDNVSNVTFTFIENKLNLKYKSGNILSIEVKDIKLSDKLINIDKIMIIEIDEEEGDIKNMYLTKRKPA